RRNADRLTARAPPAPSFFPEPVPQPWNPARRSARRSVLLDALDRTRCRSYSSAHPLTGQEEHMAALRYASFGLVLLLFGCASLNPKPIEVDMPSAQKHFIVQVDGDQKSQASTAR